MSYVFVFVVKIERAFFINGKIIYDARPEDMTGTDDVDDNGCFSCGSVDEEEGMFQNHHSRDTPTTADSFDYTKAPRAVVMAIATFIAWRG